MPKQTAESAYQIKANRSNYADTAVCHDFGTVAVLIRPNVLHHCSVTKQHTDIQTIPVDAANAADMPGTVSSILTKSADTAVCLFTAAPEANGFLGIKTPYKCMH